MYISAVLHESPQKRQFNSSYEIIEEYAEYSTIQGLIYLFFDYQTLFGRIFWTVVLIAMTALGLYWTIQSYVDWKHNPVLTTVTTTAFPVKHVNLYSFHYPYSKFKNALFIG